MSQKKFTFPSGKQIVSSCFGHFHPAPKTGQETKAEQEMQAVQKNSDKYSPTTDKAQAACSLLKETVCDNVKSVDEKRKKFIPERRKSRAAGYAVTGVLVFSAVLCFESAVVPAPETSGLPSYAEAPFQSSLPSVSRLSFISETQKSTDDTEVWISDTGEVQTVVRDEETAEESEKPKSVEESSFDEFAEESCKAEKETETTEETEAEVQKPKEYTISVHSLTVRAEPKNSSKDIGYYHAGSVFKASPAGKGWYEVSYSGQTGYVYGDGYLIETEAE